MGAPSEELDSGATIKSPAALLDDDPPEPSATSGPAAYDNESASLRTVISRIGPCSEVGDNLERPEGNPSIG